MTSCTNPAAAAAACDSNTLRTEYEQNVVFGGFSTNSFYLFCPSLLHAEPSLYGCVGISVSLLRFEMCMHGRGGGGGGCGEDGRLFYLDFKICVNIVGHWVSVAQRKEENEICSRQRR